MPATATTPRLVTGLLDVEHERPARPVIRSQHLHIRQANETSKHQPANAGT
jgi:hypothetical protein